MWRQNSQIYSTFACSHPYFWLSWFPDCTAHAWRRNVWSVSVSFIRVRGQISPCWRRKIQISPPPGEQDQSNAPLVPQGQPPPHAVPPPRQLYIDRSITWQKVKTCAIKLQEIECPNARQIRLRSVHSIHS